MCDQKPSGAESSRRQERAHRCMLCGVEPGHDCRWCAWLQEDDHRLFMDEDDDDMFQPAYARAAGGDEGGLATIATNLRMFAASVHSFGATARLDQQPLRATDVVASTRACRCEAGKEQGHQEEGGVRQQAGGRQEAEEGARQEGSPWHESKTRSQAAGQEVIGLGHCIHIIHRACHSLAFQPAGLCVDDVACGLVISGQLLEDTYEYMVSAETSDKTYTEQLDEPCPHDG